MSLICLLLTFELSRLLMFDACAALVLSIGLLHSAIECDMCAFGRLLSEPRYIYCSLPSVTVDFYFVCADSMETGNVLYIAMFIQLC